MTRGNQRELARLKNAKKQQELLKSKGANGQAGNQGLSTDKRLDRDAEVMRKKQEAAAAKKAADDAAAATNQKKVVKIDPLKI